MSGSTTTAATPSAEVIPGQAVALMPGVCRVTAPNGGPLTGPGTNSYLLGEDADVVLDPGPALPSHIDAILAAAGGRLSHIVVTHTHPDHSPAAAPLREATGAECIGVRLEPNDGFQDESFVPQRRPSHGELLQLPGCALRALHTPGHVANHFCYLLEREKLLFTGDHIMNGSTVVIIPPHGDMSDYLASLRLLKDYSLSWLGPGHGALIDHPSEAVDWLINHRMGRERKVVTALERASDDLDALLLRVYDDVDPSLHFMAKQSLHAHLIKLRHDGRVDGAEDTVWQLLN